VNTFLTNEQIAEYFTAGHGPLAPDSSPVDLEAKVKAYLERHGLTHRAPDAFLIALAAVRLAKESAPEPAPTPETPAQVDVREGFGVQRPDYGAMSVYEYARHREQLGIGQPDLLKFLSGGA
jgi:hypothetical protein